MKKTLKLTGFLFIALFLWASMALAYPVQSDDLTPYEPITKAPVIIADVGTAAPTIVITPVEILATEAISTDEIKSPVVAPTPEELPGLATKLIQLIKNKSWPAAIALGIVMLMGVLKLDFIGNLLGKYVPKRLMPLIPIGLGVIAGAIQGWVSGGWQQAAQVVVESGVLAIAFHQIWSHTVKGKDSNTNG